jgi:hypothetical protein
VVVQQAVARLPWGHNVSLLDRVGSRDERLWYARQPIGVSAYRLLEKLPAKLKGSLRTVAELEAELEGKIRPGDG